MRRLVLNGWAAGPEIWDLCTFAHDWVFSYLEELDGVPERVIAESDGVLLVGFSMGGTKALELTLRFPEKVRGLVLVSATPRMMEDRDHGWKGMSTRRLQALRYGTELVFREDPSPLYAPANMDRGLDYLQAADWREGLRRRAAEFAHLPVAVIQSERDYIVAPQNAAFLKEVFPQAQVTMVAGNEHVLPVKVPDLIDSAVNGLATSLVRTPVSANESRERSR